MKAAVLAVGALVGGATANAHHAHHAFHKRQNDTNVVCSLVVETVTGDFIWSPTPNAVPASQKSASTSYSTSTYTSKVSKASTVTLPASTHTADAVPTPAAQTCPTPGTYTYPASTVTLTSTTSGVVPSTTAVTPGTYTLGGATTIVETSTTIVCPYATVSTNTAGVVTSVIESTTYVCPSAGTYTINPTTTTVTVPETVTVPVISTYLPGVYTAPAVTTVVETSTVVYCPFASSTAESTTSSTSVAAPATTSSTSSVAAPATTGSTSSVVPVVASSSAAESSAAAPSSSAAAPSSSAAAPSSAAVASSVASASPSATSSASTSVATHSTGALGQWAITYTPYNPTTGDCQSASQVEADLLAISLAGFSTIRLYSTDCDTLPNVGSSAASNGLKIIPGIYVSATGCTIDTEDIAEQVDAFKTWEHWDLVEFFAVANEALNNGYCSGEQLASLITAVKGELGSYYSGQWTTTDVVSAWQNEEAAAAVCAVVDFPSANAHAYFTSTVAPSDAGAFVKGQLEIVEQACGGVSGYILESGYPTQGSEIGLNIPSIANQAIAISSILETIGDKVVLFSMFDDQWKSPGAYDCEQYWGIAPSLFGTVAEAWEALVAAL